MVCICYIAIVKYMNRVFFYVYVESILYMCSYGNLIAWISHVSNARMFYEWDSNE